MLLKDIISTIESRGAKLVVDDSAKEVILEKGTDEKYGARPLKRAIQKLLEDKVAMLSLKGSIQKGTVITVKGENGDLALTTVTMNYEN